MRKIISYLVLLMGMSGSALAIAEWPLGLRGEQTQGGHLFGKTVPGTTVHLNNSAVMITRDGEFFLGFGRDAALHQVLELTAPNGTRYTVNVTLSARDYDIQRINGLPPSKVTPPPEVLARIQEENRAVGEARRRRDPRADFLQPFVWPSVGPISGVYGSQRILNGEPRRPHFGVDVAAPTGTPVVAPAAGTITLTHPDMYYSGGTIVLDHGHGLSSTFLHLSKLHVKTGQRVEQGDLIGEIGATGRVTGAHLDWRMNWRDQRIDPALLVGPMPTQ